MKRDMDIIRELLLKLETWPLGRQGVAILAASDEKLAIEGTTSDQIAQHLRLLVKQNLIDCGDQRLSGVYAFRGLTWAGHDFLDSVRDDEIWRTTKSGVEAAGGFTIDIVVGLAKAIITSKIKELTGLHL